LPIGKGRGKSKDVSIQGLAVSEGNNIRSWPKRNIAHGGTLKREGRGLKGRQTRRDIASSDVRGGERGRKNF